MLLLCFLSRTLCPSQDRQTPVHPLRPRLHVLDLCSDLPNIPPFPQRCIPEHATKHTRLQDPRTGCSLWLGCSFPRFCMAHHFGSNTSSAFILQGIPGNTDRGWESETEKGRPMKCTWSNHSFQTQLKNQLFQGACTTTCFKINLY